jgi:hypothetical protein
MPSLKHSLLRELCERLTDEGIKIKAAKGVEGYESPLPITNDGFGSGMPRRPDIVGFDPALRRVVFGLVRATKDELDSEDSLEEYNVFLDHNASLGEHASVVYVIMPKGLLNLFTEIVTHYIHRDYWERIRAMESTG